MKKPYFLYIIAVLILSSCNFKKQSPERIRALAEEVELRKIKQVTNIEMFEKIESVAKTILAEVNEDNIDSLESNHKCMIRKLNLNQSNFPDSISAQLAEAYSYSLSLEQDLQAISQFSPKEDYLIYTSPFETIVKDSSSYGFWYIKCPKREIILKL